MRNKHPVQYSNKNRRNQFPGSVNGLAPPYLLQKRQWSNRGTRFARLNIRLLFGFVSDSKSTKISTNTEAAMLSQKNTRAASNFPWIPVAIFEEYIFQFQIQYLVKQSISKIAPFLILKYFFHLQQDCGPGPGEDLDTADTTFRFSCWWLTAGKSQFW